MTRFLSIALLSFCYILSAQADIYSASNALSRGDYKKALTEFTKLAEKGDANAQANLGYMYYAGEGVEQDYEKAVYWYRKAATQGNKDAQYNLAVSYAFGEGTKQDLTEAAIWYRRAGEQNHVVSQYSLAISYAYGEGVPQNQKEAARWFKKAAEQGYSRAQVNLGSMYHTGEGIKQDYTEAARWYRMAADRGDATAQYNLGTMYRSGKGVEQNYAQAKRWFRQSADQGYAAAQNELASLERSAAANVATRTIQAKPKLPTPKAAPTKVEEKVAVQKAEPKEPEQTTAPEPSEQKKKALFSVETEGLLSLDASELDIITEPKTTVETKVEKEVIIPEDAPKEIASAKEEIIEKENIADISETEPDNTSAIHNALGLPSPTKTADEELESSGGFFDKLFSNNETVKPDSAITEEVEVKETPKPKKEFVTTPRTYPEDIKATEIAAIEETKVDEEVIEAKTEEVESSEGFFSRLFSSKETSEPDVSIDETKNVAETVEQEAPIAKIEEEVIPQPKVKKEFTTTPRTYPEDVKAEDIAKVEEMKPENPVVANNDWATADTEENNESSGGLFSAIGDFFSGDNKTETISVNETEVETETEDLVIAKMDDPTPIVEEIELSQKAETNLNQYSVHAGRRALTNNNFDEALENFRPLAEAGDSEAQSHLGSLYYVGKGVNKNLSEAYNWYKKSAVQGNMDAQYSIANMYLLGEGVEQNNETAANWYTLASKQGHIPASNNLKSLNKLESLNRENQLKLDAIAEEQKTKENITETQPPESNTNVYTAGESPTEPLQTLEKENSTEEDTQTISSTSETDSIEKTIEEESSNDIASNNDSQSPSSDSPGFFESLFGSSDDKKTNEVEVVDHSLAKEVEDIDLKPVPIKEEIIVETEIEEAVEAVKPTDEILVETSEEQINTEEDSGGLLGFFGNIFSSDNKNESDNSEPESTEELAMLEVKTEQTSTNIDEVAMEITTEEITEEATPVTKIEELRPLAIQGDQQAQYKLGALYYSGDSVKQDYSQAALWYRRAAQQGHIDAQYSLGNMFLMGEGLSQNDRQAAEWYTLAAEQGHDSARHNLESIQKTLESNSVIEVETETADNSSQLISLDEKIVDTTSSSDITGKPEYEQGLAYTFGDGVAQNDRTAFNLFYESAEKGYVLAQYKVGVAFAYGEGVRQDQKKAAEWYRKSAEQGYTIAQRNLATMYLNGKGVDQNKVQALAWYQVVANAGNAMDLHRRDMLKKELSDVELSESQKLSKQITSKISNPSL